jgi:UDP-N-acetylmuramoylalanine--D-glutamate ligase
VNRLLVLGAGISGRAAGRLARSRGMSVTLFSDADSPEAREEGFSLATGQWDPVLLTGVDLVVASPGFAERSLPVVESLESGLPVWSEIEFAWHHLTKPVAAVTGTNGKTTVTEATSAMLTASGLDAPATGNIGMPLSDFVDEPADTLVVEVSSFQLRFIESFHPIAAAITNIAADHLDWHGSESAYRNAKSRIFLNQSEDDLLVFDADDPGAASVAASAPGELFPVSGTHLPQGGGGVSGGVLVIGEVSIDVDDLISPDPIHLVDLAISAALALRMGGSAEGVTNAALSYAPGRHRRETVLIRDGVRWVDDSKATNPHSAIASIRSHDSVVLIGGGLAKGLDLAPIAREPNLKAVIGIGEDGAALVEAAGERGHLAGTMEVAVALATEIATPGDTVLLAPGCASFDQFGSYAERGERFAALVGATTGG